MQQYLSLLPSAVYPSYDQQSEEPIPAQMFNRQKSCGRKELVDQERLNASSEDLESLLAIQAFKNGI